MTVNGTHFDEDVWFADPGILDLFTFPLEFGDPASLENPEKVILSRSLALKLFGRTDVIGQSVTLTFQETKQGEFTVGGVARASENERSFAFSALIPFRQFQIHGTEEPDDWGTLVSATFIRTGSTGDLAGLAERLQPMLERHQAALSPVQRERFPTTSFAFENVTDLSKDDGQVVGNFMNGPNTQEEVFLMVLAFVLLLLVCISYINMAIASASRRIKEIGIRKVLGGNRPQLVFQFLTENLLPRHVSNVVSMREVACLMTRHPSEA